MTLQATPIAAGSYQNLAETDRRVIEKISGGRYGVLSGLALTPGAGMQMLVAAGDAMVRGRNVTGQGAYFVSDTAQNVVAWPVASGTNPRIDSLILAVGDTQYGALGASMGGTQGPKFVVVSGTAAASPVAPTDAAIQTAIGAGGWERVADVLIPTSAASILAGNITPPTTWAIGTAREFTINRVMAASQTFTNPTTFQPFPASADRTAMLGTLIKARAGSYLHCSASVSVALQSGAAQRGLLGLRFNGVTDVELGRTRFNAAGPTRAVISGHAFVPGLAAGIVTVEPILASETAASLITWATDDCLSYTVREGS
jgi:hypothetical protein